MKIIFAGTPAFSTPALEALANAGHEIELVLTQPDRPAGRGMKAAASAVKVLSQKHGFALLQPESLKQLELHARLAAIGADVMVVVAYGLILPLAVLNLPKFGCLNIHASLLPRWRGAAPIERAILAGDRETGITIMQMDQGLDTGPILLQRPIPIVQDDTSQTLRDKLALLGAGCIVEVLELMQHHALLPVRRMLLARPTRLNWKSMRLRSTGDQRLKISNARCVHSVHLLAPTPGFMEPQSRYGRRAPRQTQEAFPDRSLR